MVLQMVQHMCPMPVCALERPDVQVALQQLLIAFVLTCRYTSIAERTFHPKWEEKFRIPVANAPKDLEFQVKVIQQWDCVLNP